MLDNFSLVKVFLENFRESQESSDTLTLVSIENASVIHTLGSIADVSASQLSLIKLRGVTDRPTAAA